MKTKLMLSALLVAWITGSTLAADPVGPKVVVVNQKESGMFKVIYEGAKAGRVNLKITNQDGVIVFNESVAGVNAFIRPLNFNGMDAGEYNIEVSDASGKQVTMVNYQIEQTVGAIHVSKIAGGNKYLFSPTVENIQFEINDTYIDWNTKFVIHTIMVWRKSSRDK